MSQSATMSLMGLYNYDPDLFSGMSWPEGFPEDNQPVFINNLLVETANLEILYPDPVFMKQMIAAWSSKQVDVWTKMYNTTKFEYDPIVNYDRTEESTDTYDRTGSGTGHSDGYEASFDTPVDVETDEDGMTKTNKADSTSSSTEKTENKHKLRAFGNIGTTMTQTMIQEERKVSEFNIIDYMIKDFRQRFCLLVYN